MVLSSFIQLVQLIYSHAFDAVLILNPYDLSDRVDLGQVDLFVDVQVLALISMFAGHNKVI